MTRLFTIHINRVSRRRSRGEKSGYTRGGPLHLACNAYVVTAMCHSRRANTARAKARPMNIYPWLLQNKCQYRGTRGERATKRNEESRNPGLRLRFSPWTHLGILRLRSHDIDWRIKISSDPPATTVDMTTTVVVGPTHFPESSDIYFCRPPRKRRTLCRLLSFSNPVLFHTFSFLYEKFGRNDNRLNKVRLLEATCMFERVSISRIALEMTFIESYTQFWFQNRTVQLNLETVGQENFESTCNLHLVKVLQ